MGDRLTVLGVGLDGREAAIADGAAEVRILTIGSVDAASEVLRVVDVDCVLTCGSTWNDASTDGAGGPTRGSDWPPDVPVFLLDTDGESETLSSPGVVDVVDPDSVAELTDRVRATLGGDDGGRLEGDDDGQLDGTREGYRREESGLSGVGERGRSSTPSSRTDATDSTDAWGGQYPDPDAVDLHEDVLPSGGTGYPDPTSSPSSDVERIDASAVSRGRVVDQSENPSGLHEDPDNGVRDDHEGAVGEHTGNVDTDGSGDDDNDGSRDDTDDRGRDDTDDLGADADRLYEIVADSSASIDDRIDRLFQLGCDRFGMEIGAIARVDRLNDTFEFEWVSDTTSEIQPGRTFHYTESYCRLLSGDETAVGVTDPESAGITDTLAYEELGVRAYIGTSLSFDGEYDRTFFFVSRTPKPTQFSAADRSFHHLMGQWLRSELERTQRETRLAGLNDLNGRLMGIDRVDELCETAVADAAETFELPYTAVLGLDTDRNALSVRARSAAAAELPLETLTAHGGPAWNVFVNGDASANHLDGFAGFTDVIVVRLANHGVLATATRNDDGFSDATAEFVETVASTLAAQIERADRERQLRRREERLEEQTEILDRLDRINDVIRNVDQSLVVATTREEIEEAVCRHLAVTGPYELAWIGTHDTVSDEVVPSTVMGDDDGYVHDITVTVTEGETSLGPAGRAMTTLEPQVVDDTLEAREFAPWRRAALDRGYRSVIALPIVYEGTRYGVLCVYADEPGSFEELDRAVLSELSVSVADAINTVESVRGLSSVTVTDLTFDLGDAARVVEVARELECSVDLQGIVRGSDGALRGYYTLRGTTAEAVHAASHRFPGSNVLVTSEYADGGEDCCVVELDLLDDSFSARVLDHGGTVESVSATPSGAEATVSVPATVDVREFVESVERWVPGSTMTAKRERQRSFHDRNDFWGQVVDELTDRQREVLETAVISGYFESPREMTGSELAETLSISQPTFNTHLRTAQRKLFELLVGRGRAEYGSDGE